MIIHEHKHAFIIVTFSWILFGFHMTLFLTVLVACNGTNIPVYRHNIIITRVEMGNPLTKPSSIPLYSRSIYTIRYRPNIRAATRILRDARTQVLFTAAWIIQMFNSFIFCSCHFSYYYILFPFSIAFFTKTNIWSLT